MPAKMARSAPRPSFGLPEVLVAVRTSRLSCRKAEKRKYSRQFGSHLGNPGLLVAPTATVGAPTSRRCATGRDFTEPALQGRDDARFS